MPTLLTNAKMAPALRERVHASVTGKRRDQKRAKEKRLFVAIARVAGAVATIAVVTVAIRFKRHEADALERDRAALLDALHAQQAALTDDDRATVAHVESWLPRLAGPYPGDQTAPELLDKGALDKLLAQPAIYVRGPVEGFGSNALIETIAVQSLKDAAAMCLLDPPSARTEKAMLPKVRAAYSGSGLLEQKTANVRRLQDGIAGLALVSPPWEKRVHDATDPIALDKLKKELDRTPLAKTKQALHATFLVAVMDEPGSGPSELDGEKVHDARVALVDLAADKVLLRVKRPLDPSGWSTNTRAELSMAMDGCALALDVRRAATK